MTIFTMLGRHPLHTEFGLTTVTLLLVSYLGSTVADFTLTIAHTNDVHARFEQFSKFGSDCRPRDAEAGSCYGGVARRKTAFDTLRQKYKNLLILDAGDQFQGTLWFFVHKGRAAATFMNLLDYDVMALGNHEFDNGVQGVVPFIENLTLPVLSCNIESASEPDLEGLFQASVVKVIGGEKIGIIGYTTTDSPQLSLTGALKFEDEVAAIRREVEKLQNQGINKIIALGHSGFKTDLEIAREVKGVDLVVGGHTNTFLYTGTPPAHESPIGGYPTVINHTSGEVTLAVQDYAFGKYIGVLHLTFNDDGDLTSWSGNPWLMDNSVEQNADILAMMTSWKEPLTSLFSSNLGRSHVLLVGDRTLCRVGECNLGNFVADSMVTWHLKFPDEAYWAKVSLAIINGGGIRSSIVPGEITLKDAYNVQPFSNTIDLVELEGRHVKAMFEHSVTDYDKLLPKGRFLQVSGFRVTYDLSLPEGSRVVQLKARCSQCTVPSYLPIVMDETYKIAVPSFIAAGGDGYSVIPENVKRHHVYGDLDIDLLIRHIGAQSPIIAELEERISFISEDYCFRPGCGLTRSLTSAAPISVPQRYVVLLGASLLRNMFFKIIKEWQ